jgi:hypothetical protein
MTRDHHDAKPAAARRQFLKSCGRYAVATPPLVTLLLSTAGPNYALAASGRRRDDPDAPADPGSAAARIIAQLPSQTPIRPVATHRISPIGAGRAVVRATRGTVCRGF